MGKFTTIQQRFTQGEIDPAMIARDDVDKYYGALATACNILTLPQGGFKRRPGLQHIDRVLGGSLTKIDGGSITETAPNGGTASNASDQNDGTSLITTTTIGTTNPYVVVHYDLGSLQDLGTLYLYGFALSAGSSDEFFLQASTNNSVWFDAGEAISVTDAAKDYSRRVHGSFRYVRLARVGSTNLSATATLTGLDVTTEAGTSTTRCLNFEFNVEQTYKMIVSDKNIAIYQGTTYLIDIYIPELTSDRLAVIDWENSADTLLIFHPDFLTITIQRSGANDVWAVGTVTYTNIPTFDFGSGAEAIWSVTRGYPRHGRFYQGRLWIDGGKSRPSVIYSSNVNDFYNFSPGAALDDEAIGPLTSGFDDIEAIYPGRNLMIFTGSAEYIIPQTFGEPITPTTAVMTSQSSIGSEEGFRPQEVEGGVMYVQRQGASIQEFLYNDGQRAFDNNFVSIFSSHLIKNPVDFALRKATSTEEGAYLLLVKGNGKLTVANILRSQAISSFVEAETEGSFKSCGVDVADMYFVVEREIDGNTVNWLERFNNDHYMDASKRFTTGLPTDTFSGLEHLEAESCNILADGAILQNETVSEGSVTIDRDADTSLEVGLNFMPIVVDLPASTDTRTGQSVIGIKKSIDEITLRLKDTSDIIVNGKLISFRGFGPSGGGSPLDIQPAIFTGVKKMLGWRGWTEDAQVTITQTDPLPMTVLSIKKRINA